MDQTQALPQFGCARSVANQPAPTLPNLCDGINDTIGASHQTTDLSG